MSEEELVSAIFGKIIEILVKKHLPEGIRKISIGSAELRKEAINEWLKKIDIVTIANVICAHLKLYLGTIVQYMTYYKKKHLFFCHELNKKEDPRMSEKKKDQEMPLVQKKSGEADTVSSVIAYENTPFSAKEFLQMLKDHEDLIPKRSIYHKFIERLLKMDTVKPLAVQRPMPCQIFKKEKDQFTD